MKILFVTSNRLGDAVLSTGLLDHLIRTYPEARITVVCGPVAEGVFARMPNRAKTIVLRKQSRGWHWLPLWAATLPHRWTENRGTRRDPRPLAAALARRLEQRRRSAAHREHGGAGQTHHRAGP